MDDHAVILFDGVCNFCNGTVNFLIRHDHADAFRFAPLQSEAGQRMLAQAELPAIDFQSFVLIEKGKAYQRSKAALRAVRRLSWWWQPLQLLGLLPHPLLDRLYNFVARHRYQWFGKKDQCMVPTAAVRSKFL